MESNEEGQTVLYVTPHRLIGNQSNWKLHYCTSELCLNDINQVSSDNLAIELDDNWTKQWLDLILIGLKDYWTKWYLNDDWTQL